MAQPKVGAPVPAYGNFQDLENPPPSQNHPLLSPFPWVRMIRAGISATGPFVMMSTQRKINGQMKNTAQFKRRDSSVESENIFL